MKTGFFFQHFKCMCLVNKYSLLQMITILDLLYLIQNKIEIRKHFPNAVKKKSMRCLAVLYSFLTPHDYF